MHRAVGEQLTCVFVDHGLNREGEPEQVEETFGRHFHVPLVHVKAADRFLAKARRRHGSRAKRKIIGEEFIRVFEEVAREHTGARFLVQGTLYPDVIESGSARRPPTSRATTTSVGLPEDMAFELVEPLRDLFKDEVRKVGRSSACPRRSCGASRSPGRASRCASSARSRPRTSAIVRGADAVVRDEIRRAGLERETWQAFAVLLADVRSVGVMGDGRTYEHPIVVRASSRARTR